MPSRNILMLYGTYGQAESIAKTIGALIQEGGGEVTVVNAEKWRSPAS